MKVKYDFLTKGLFLNEIYGYFCDFYFRLKVY